MLVFSLLAVATAPGIALLTYVYLKDKYDSEPLHMVIKVFLLGFLIVLPIMIIQRGLSIWLGGHPFWDSFAVSAGVEEIIKWFVLVHLIYNHTEFDEPYDGIVYAAAISLGFATAENLLYVWAGQPSVGTLLLRSLLPVSGHAMFGVMMGYYMGLAKFCETKRTRSYLTIALLLPWFWHGVYDIILDTVENNWIWFIVPLMAFLWYRGMGKIKRANSRSPHRFVKRDEEVNM